MKNKIELSIENVGKLIIEPNTKIENELFYKFVPSKEFDEKLRNILQENKKSQLQIERQLEKKLLSIYRVYGR